MMQPEPYRLDPISTAWNTVARYRHYDDAQAAVDYLSDERFPVEHLDIIGSDLHLVERVTGRLTKLRAAGAGAATGAWFGLLIGVLVGFFTRGPLWLGLILGGVLIGAAWGAIFGFIGHALTRGRRDFSSTRTLVADCYDVIARGGRVEQARAMLESGGLLATAIDRQPAAGDAAGDAGTPADRPAGSPSAGPGQQPGGHP